MLIKLFPVAKVIKINRVSICSIHKDYQNLIFINFVSNTYTEHEMNFDDKQQLLKRTKNVLKCYLAYHIFFDLLLIAAFFDEGYIFCGKEEMFQTQFVAACSKDPWFLIESLIRFPIEFIFSPYIVMFDF